MNTLDNLSVQLYDEDTLNIDLANEDTFGVSLTSDLSVIVVNDYEQLTNLPQINSVVLIGNVLSSQLNIKLSDLTQENYDVLNCGTSTTVI